MVRSWIYMIGMLSNFEVSTSELFLWFPSWSGNFIYVEHTQQRVNKVDTEPGKSIELNIIIWQVLTEQCKHTKHNPWKYSSYFRFGTNIIHFSQWSTWVEGLFPLYFRFIDKCAKRYPLKVTLSYLDQQVKFRYVLKTN